MGPYGMRWQSLKVVDDHSGSLARETSSSRQVAAGGRHACCVHRIGMLGFTVLYILLMPASAVLAEICQQLDIH